MYDPEYLARSDATALDPIVLPLSRKSRLHREHRQDGVFGVLRDVSPEGYGLALLETRLGRELSPIERLEAAFGDAVGNIEVCDDIEHKVAYRPVAMADLLAVLEGLPETAQASRAVREAHGVQGTTLGGERPKLTVLHRGQQWIAKFRERGDAHNSPLREYLAMRSARACDIHTPDVEFMQVGPHPIYLIARFDRHVQDDGKVQRCGYASAHTLLGLDSAATRGDPQRSYPYLAAELRRWCAGPDRDVRPMQRELWRRMAFNALCGNGDDHPRNHGVRHVDGAWELAPAFDIAPFVRFDEYLAMRVTRDGYSDATRWALLRDCESFQYTEDEAGAYLDAALRLLTSTWESERARLGLEVKDAQSPTPGDWLDAPPPADLQPKRYPRARHRST